MKNSIFIRLSSCLFSSSNKLLLSKNSIFFSVNSSFVLNSAKAFFNLLSLTCSLHGVGSKNIFCINFVIAFADVSSFNLLNSSVSLGVNSSGFLLSKSRIFPSFSFNSSLYLSVNIHLIKVLLKCIVSWIQFEIASYKFTKLFPVSIFVILVINLLNIESLLFIRSSTVLSVWSLFENNAGLIINSYITVDRSLYFNESRFLKISRATASLFSLSPDEYNSPFIDK